MIILGIESSSPVASVALVSEEKLWGEMTLNTGLSHSEQLLPLIDELLRQTKVELSQLAGIAVSGGPGSFTGLRIGMATAKGLAQGLNIPLLSIPTLLALAYQQAGYSGLVSPVLNARRNEVYTTLFRFNGSDYQQLADYQALSPQLWAEKLREYGEPIVFTGDGVTAYGQVWQENLGDKAVFVPQIFWLMRGACVAELGLQRLRKGEEDELFTLKPMYIRSSEAERKLACGNR